jgi:hypothetical protein
MGTLSPSVAVTGRGVLAKQVPPIAPPKITNEAPIDSETRLMGFWIRNRGIRGSELSICRYGASKSASILEDLDSSSFSCLFGTLFVVTIKDIILGTYFTYAYGLAYGPVASGLT